MTFFIKYIIYIIYVIYILYVSLLINMAELWDSKDLFIWENCNSHSWCNKRCIIIKCIVDQELSLLKSTKTFNSSEEDLKYFLEHKNKSFKSLPVLIIDQAPISDNDLQYIRSVITKF